MKRDYDREQKSTQEKIDNHIKAVVLKESQDGNIVVACFDGLQKMKLDDFIKQPIEGMLYDLNRDESVVLTFINDPKWINDFAVAKVIRALKQRIDELENKTH